MVLGRSTRARATVSLIVAAGFFACRTTNDSSVKDTEVRTFEGELGMKAGVGYETIFEDVRGNCVEFDGIETNGTAQTVTYDVSMIENHHDLGTSLNVSSAAQVKAAIPDSPATVSAKTNFMLGHSYTLNRYSIYIVAKVEVRNETTQLKNPRISASVRSDLATAVQDADAVDRFRLKCGDSFLSGYTTGGEFFGVIELSTDNEEQKAELKRDVEATLALKDVGEVSTQQTFEAKLSNVTKNKKLKIWTYQRGGAGAEQVGLVDTPEAMLARIKAFPGYVTQGSNAANYTATFKDYFTLDVPLPTAYRDALLSAQDNMGELAGIESQLIDRRGDIDYVLAHPNSFEGMTPAKLTELGKDKTTNQTLMKRIYTTARDCYRKFRECKIPADIQPKALSLPNRKSTVGDLARDFILLKTNLQNIDLDALYDGPFNPPECYLEVRVVGPNGDFKRIRRTPTTYDKPRCNNLNQTLELPLALLKETLKGLGVSEDDGVIEVRAMEDDPGAANDDTIATLSKKYKDIIAASAVVDTMTGPNLTMGVDFEVH